MANAEKLCMTCEPEGRCRFKDAVNTTVSSVPPVERQTPIKPGSSITEDASWANQDISALRGRARELECPNLNTVNPNYPGKRNL